LGEAAHAVLLTADPGAKAARSRDLAAAWREGRLEHAFPGAMPARPARPARPVLLPPSKMPKRGRAGSARSRVALLHALAHIEFNAIDLAWDAAGRFGAAMPRAFADDWVRVGDDEARHFLLLADRLAELGAAYGDLPAHDGLWQAAMATSGDLLARLAVVPQVLEARGLDVTPATEARLRASGDASSADIVRTIYHDEIIHVSLGNRWFRQLCVEHRIDAAETFRQLVSRYFRGSLKRPFNDSARIEAGLTPDFYETLASPAAPSHQSPMGSGASTQQA
jgi:uncharacterized ferritin-like protein (DUF455 family)